MVAAACARRLQLELVGKGGGEVPAGQPLRGRDFCLFGYVSTHETDGATVEPRYCRQANTSAERALTRINISDLLIDPASATIRRFRRSLRGLPEFWRERGASGCIFTSSICLCFGHDPGSVLESTHAPELDGRRPRARDRCQRDHGTEFRSREACGWTARADTDEAGAGGGRHPVHGGGRRSPGYLIISVDVAFQRIAGANKFCINEHPSRDIPPTSTQSPARAGLLFLLEAMPGLARRAVAGSGSQPIRIDAHEQPDDRTEHQSDRGPLSDFVHSHPPRLL
jgi:hypothetical protein